MWRYPFIMLAALVLAATTHGEESILIGPFDVKLQLRNEEVRIFDVRSKAAFEKAHIPGAVWFDLATFKEKTLSEGGLQDAAFWGKAFGELGVNNTTRVTVYGDSPTDAARGWWICKYVGVTHVAMLDGGIGAWENKEYPLEDVPPEYPQKTFRANLQTHMLADFESANAASTKENVVVVDARSEGEFTGAAQKGEKAGRIAGAVHLEWKELLDETGNFKPREELRKLFAAKGIKPDAEIITHCYSGGRASVNVLALKLAGFENVKNYYCGWSEFASQPEAKIETGESKPDTPKDDKPLCRVQGTITLDGKPVASAVIRLKASDKKSFEARTNADGKFELRAASPGAHVIEIQSEPVPNPPAEENSIPKKYGAASSLRIEVREGENEFNFDLTSE